ncbi:NADB-Rossmann family domain-containing protein [Colletotrichum incanum]|nr:NADB-Rossmann family domain-containing protein [Colletotrichum incanum]
MVTVAIAGGTGDRSSSLGKAPASQEDIALAPTFQVDYSDVDALKAFLEQKGVHTVISALGITATSLATSQLNLVRAAEQSSVTRRFIPSSFAIRYPEGGAKVLPPLEHYLASLALLSTTTLEWAVVPNGTFLEYFAPTIALDIAHSAAAIPGDGDAPVSFTYTFDVARYVVAALDLASWPASNELRVVGDELTFNEFVKLAEEVRGVEFDVVYDDVEKLQRFGISE